MKKRCTNSACRKEFILSTKQSACPYCGQTYRVFGSMPVMLPKLRYRLMDGSIPERILDIQIQDEAEVLMNYVRTKPLLVAKKRSVHEAIGQPNRIWQVYMARLSGDRKLKRIKTLREAGSLMLDGRYLGLFQTKQVVEQMMFEPTLLHLNGAAIKHLVESGEFCIQQIRCEKNSHPQSGKSRKGI